MQGYLFLESFAGSAAATKAVKAQFPSAETAAFDIKYSKSMDVNSSGGMASLAFSVQQALPECRFCYSCNREGTCIMLVQSPVSGKGNAAGYHDGTP